MADQRLQYNEEVVGAGHATKSDTANRLALVECDSDGKGLKRYLKKQASHPDTGADEGCLYTYEVDGAPELRWRGENNATPLQMTSAGTLLAGMRIKSIQSGQSTGAMAYQYEDTIPVSISAVDMSKAIVLVSGVCINKSRGAWKAKLTSATNLDVVLQNFDNSQSSYSFHWAVMEVDNASVQRGELSQAVASGSTDTANVTVATANQARSFLVFSGYALSPNTTSLGGCLVSYRQTTDTNLLFALYNPFAVSVTYSVPWQLVTLDN